MNRHGLAGAVLHPHKRHALADSNLVFRVFKFRHVEEAVIPVIGPDKSEPALSIEAHDCSVFVSTQVRSPSCES
jgi:hypothetical protein